MTLPNSLGIREVVALHPLRTRPSRSTSRLSFLEEPKELMEMVPNHLHYWFVAAREPKQTTPKYLRGQVFVNFGCTRTHGSYGTRYRCVAPAADRTLCPLDRPLFVLVDGP